MKKKSGNYYTGRPVISFFFRGTYFNVRTFALDVVVVEFIPPDGPIELFFVPASAPQLVYQNLWFVPEHLTFEIDNRN